MNYIFFYRNRGLLVAPPVLLSLINPFLTDKRLFYWVTGMIIFLSGWLIRVWAQQFLHYRLKMDMCLTISGPYLFVRNPIYIGNILLATGLVLTTGAYYMVILTILWYGVIYHFVVRYEEEVLRKRYGMDYIEYTLKVKRWQPGFKMRGVVFTGDFLLKSILVELNCILFIIPFVIRELLLQKCILSF